MAMTEVTVTTSLATTAAFALAGPCRLRADDMIAGDSVYLYEERIDGDYDPVMAQSVPGSSGRGHLFLDKGLPSVLFEGYGNYKAVVSRADLVFGYTQG